MGETYTGGREIYFKNTVTESIQSTRPQMFFGGILADGMGLGKTLSMLSLITVYLDHSRGTSLPNNQEDSSHSTLIVTPLSLLQTWEEQIQRHLYPGVVSFHIYHGSARRPLQPLGDYDIVLTTYDTIVAEKFQKSSKRKGENSIESI